MVFLAPNGSLEAANPNLNLKPTHPLAAWKAPLGAKNTKHPLRREISVLCVWKKNSDDAEIVILRHRRLFCPEARDYSQ